MNKALEFIEEIVKGSYQPVEDRFPNRFQRRNVLSDGGRLDYLASQWAQRGTGVAEMFGSMLLATSDMPYSFPAAIVLAIDGASRAGSGQGIIANTRSIGRDIAKYFRRSYTQ
jgi:hypothetical protein